MAMRPGLGIIVASIREGRRGAPIGAWTYAQALEHGRFDVDLIDLEAESAGDLAVRKGAA